MRTLSVMMMTEYITYSWKLWAETVEEALWG